MAEIYLVNEDWGVTKHRILSTNAFQCSSAASSVRMERELRQRLQHLTTAQLRLLADATSQDRARLAWLAAVKHSALLFEIAAGLLRSKLEIHDNILRPADLERFFSQQRAAHPELTRITSSSFTKIRNVLLLMLKEADILLKGRRDGGLGIIHRPILPADIQEAILNDDGQWLAAFLVPDSEIFY